MHARLTVTLIVALLAGLWLAPGAMAQDDAKEALRASMKERYPALVQLKKDGKIGETYLGYIELVELDYARDEKLNALVKAENQDRRALYEIIAKEHNTTPEKVAQRNAQRNFANAQDYEWLKHTDGVWRKKGA
ncbi:MAG: DUF1318 domain-containing protein [Phycisphaeraceae bacterium]